MVLNKIAELFSNDMGIDLGTANTLVYVKGKGIVIDEPSVVAIHKESGKILAVGRRAKEMVGKTHGEIVAIRPLKDGVIADFEATQKMIKYFIMAAHNRKSFVRPRIVIGIPSGITQVEKKAVRESAEQAGAREIYLIEEALAAAIGAGIPIEEAAGHMVVDIGGGTTEIAVISMGGIIEADSIRVGGDEMDEAIINYLKKVHNLQIGPRTAEEIKIKIGNVYPNPKFDKETIEVRGSDVITGLPKTIDLSAAEIREALMEPVNIILDHIKGVLERTPPELAADIVERGIVLTGGGSLLRGLNKKLAEETGVPAILADEPLRCVVKGTGMFLEVLKKLKETYKEIF